ncbi:DUF4450 domain-containing protein [Croceibacterium sp. TMG7-5b_MA50]|uniref:DUF4450 domain-containing protein n=1 Tax=Croceibacterium sp. TMG7-5b_MA50 TaxID=3121290 RepID=UPI003221C79A
MLAPVVSAQTLVATEGVQPNLEGELARPVRYTPDGDAFRIENGTERYNRPLYGGNTAFRVDGGDLPEFVLYLPGRGGNLRFAVRLADGTRFWLHDAAAITTRYRPGELEYSITDPRLGSGTITLIAVALAETEGLAISAKGEGIAGGIALDWAFGGVSGQRGTRDGDIGTERVPISQWFGFQPEFADGNIATLSRDSFTLAGKPGTITGTVLNGTTQGIVDGAGWQDAATLFTPADAAVQRPVVTGTLALAGEGAFLLLQRTGYAPASGADLATYSAVSADRRAPPPRPPLADAFAAADLPAKFAAARRHFADLRGQVRITTPDPWLNAAVASLNVAADAVWDGPQQAIMHGAVAWRTKLLGWRGPYALDALGWHDRARANFRAWLPRQNTDPVPDSTPPADADSNLARSEAALHSNGDFSNSHYDMNAVFIDALFRHLAWTGDLDFAREAWPAIQRHLAWEKRLFRRPFGPEGLPLYEAYAQIWASDDIGYNGGGVAYASAYNLFHNREAARIARALGEDPTAYEAEAEAIGRAMRAQLWMPGQGVFAEYRDWLGEGMLHPSAGLWSFYHTVDSGVPDRQEAWRMADALGRTMPRLPVHGAGVPDDRPYGVYASSDWMPYTWSVNNVVMGENLHTALALWQAGRAEEAVTLAKGALLASMYMGISPGNVGSMNYLDVHRREAQRDFADGSGVTSRAMVEGLFGVRPDALARRLEVAPGLPAAWDHAALDHPDVSLSFRRDGATERWTVRQPADRFAMVQLRLGAPMDDVAAVTVDGQPARWQVDAEAVGGPAILIEAPFGHQAEIVVRWGGRPVVTGAGSGTTFVERQQGAMRWWQPTGEAPQAEVPPQVTDRAPVGRQRAVDLTFNDGIEAIFAPGKYVAPRSPFTSLALPSQGLGAWAGHVKATAEIDDAGLRTAAQAGDGWLTLPDGGRFRTPAEGHNALFVSKWENYPDEATVPLSGKGAFLRLLVAGTTNAMQSRIDNGEVIVTYTDGTTTRLALHNPTTWWPIERDYLADDYQFRIPGPRPLRVDLATAKVRQAGGADGGTGPERRIPGGSATVLGLPLDSQRTLQSLTVRARANEVVIGLLAATIDEGV